MSDTSNPPSESTLTTEIDRILTRLEQLGLAPTAIEKIASGDVFEARNEAKSEIIKLVNRAIIGELKRYPPTAYRGDDYLGGFNDARRQLEERIKELEEDK